MPLDEAKATEIISLFKGLDVDQRYSALMKAREIFPTFFSAEMTNLEYAKSAMILEQLYNIIREELRVPQHRIKSDTSGVEPKASKKAKTEAGAASRAEKKKQSMTMQMDDMMKAFAMFSKEKTNEKLSS